MNVERQKERSELLINWSIKESDSRHCCNVNEKQEEDLKQDNKCLTAALKLKWS